MTFNIDLPRLKNPCLVRTNLIIGIIKISLFVAICQALKYFFKLQDFWILPVWVGLTILIDGFLIFKKPSIFENISLGKENQQRYGLNPEELRRYLSFSPKIRLSRTLFIALIILVFFKRSDWTVSLLVALFSGFIILDPILKYIFNIKTPLIYEHSTDYKPGQSLDELHRNDISWAGSQAWIALNSTRQFDDFPKR